MEPTCSRHSEVFNATRDIANSAELVSAFQHLATIQSGCGWEWARLCHSLTENMASAWLDVVLKHQHAGGGWGGLWSGCACQGGGFPPEVDSSLLAATADGRTINQKVSTHQQYVKLSLLSLPDDLIGKHRTSLDPYKWGSNTYEHTHTHTIGLSLSTFKVAADV